MGDLSGDSLRMSRILVWKSGDLSGEETLSLGSGV